MAIPSSAFSVNTNASWKAVTAAQIADTIMRGENSNTELSMDLPSIRYQAQMASRRAHRYIRSGSDGETALKTVAAPIHSVLSLSPARQKEATGHE